MLGSGIDGLARGAEVEQHRNAVITKKYVVGLDVPVDESRVVDEGQALQQRNDDVHQVALADDGAHLQCAGQRLSPLVFHHHVGGAIGLEYAVYADDVGVLQCGQRFRFLEKATDSVGEFLRTVRGNRGYLVVPLARGDVFGKVFLDGNLAPEVFIVSQVGDPESAGSEHRANPVPMQLVSFRQGVGEAATRRRLYLLGNVWLRYRIFRLPDRCPFEKFTCVHRLCDAESLAQMTAQLGEPFSCRPVFDSDRNELAVHRAGELDY